MGENRKLLSSAFYGREMYIAVTDRGATDALIELADLVTEMKEIKHPCKAGIKAQQGIEF